MVVETARALSVLGASATHMTAFCVGRASFLLLLFIASSFSSLLPRSLRGRRPSPRARQRLADLRSRRVLLQQRIYARISRWHSLCAECTGRCCRGSRDRFSRAEVLVCTAGGEAIDAQGGEELTLPGFLRERVGWRLAALAARLRASEAGPPAGDDLHPEELEPVCSHLREGGCSLPKGQRPAMCPPYLCPSLRRRLSVADALFLTRLTLADAWLLAAACLVLLGDAWRPCQAQ